MNESMPRDAGAGEQALRNEIVRLNKIIEVLMNRAERSSSVHSSDFNLFQSAILLEEQVLRRTQELEASLRENEKINRALREAENKFHSVLDQSLVGITMVVDGRFQYANPKFAEIIGYSVDEILQLGPTDITPESDRAYAIEAMRRGLAGELKQISLVVNALRKDGSIITVEISGNAAINIGGKSALIEVWADITEKLRIEREVNALQNQLREQAIRDPLTGLYNRLYLNESLERELILAERHDYCVSVVMTDLDHFKAVNDCYGHLAGDEVLRVFAGLMKRHSRSSDINCRYGGEEFFLVLPDMAEEKACERAEQLRAAIAAESVVFGEADIPVTASFGVASFPNDGKTGNDLMMAADKALYAAKDAGRNRVKCHPDRAVVDPAKSLPDRLSVG
jgi:diguanylate cyclase (GGDEF)-like protein/PAS domain S-box-containing protein